MGTRPMFTWALKKILGTSHEREVKRLRPRVQAINALEPAIQKLSDAELKAKTAEFKQKLDNGASLEDILHEAFAVAREAGWRALKMRHFDVQLIGGMVLHKGSIAEKGPTPSVIEHPRHPYVQLLLGSIPVPDPKQRWQTSVRIPSEDDQLQVGVGCPFYARCSYHMERCRAAMPPRYEVNGDGHQCACYLCDQAEKGGASHTNGGH